MSIVLATGIEFELRGQKYRIERMLEANVAEARNFFQKHDVLTLRSSDFMVLSGCGELKFLNQKGKRSPIGDFSQISEEQREEAVKRYDYVTKVQDLTRDKHTADLVKLAIAQTAQEKGDASPPSMSTVYRWRNKFVSSGWDIRALVTNHQSKGCRQSKLDSEVQIILEEKIQEKYSRSRYFTVNDLESAVRMEIKALNKEREAKRAPLLKVPSYTTIRNRLHKVDSYDLIKSRYGKKAAERIFRYIGDKDEPTRPLELCQIDHTILDLFVISRKNNLPMGRPTFTAMMDVFSRCICGFYVGFDPPGYLPAMYCLRHSISPKDYISKNYPDIENPWPCYGKPEVVVTDNGLEFIHKSFEDAMYQLNAKLIQAPPREPQFKGAIERFIGTLNTSCLQSIPGATFSDKKSRKDELLKYGFNPEKDAVVYFDDLVHFLHLFFCDYYHRRPHKGLGGRIPSKVWEEGVKEHPLILPQSTEDLRVLLGRIETRQLRQIGIEWQGLIYNSRNLDRLRFRALGQDVIFKYDPSEISQIYVFDKVMNEYIKVKALNQKHTENLSLWEHQAIMRKAREETSKVDSDALARARMKLQAMIEKRLKKPKIRTMKKIARSEGQRFDSSTLKADSSDQLSGLELDGIIKVGYSAGLSDEQIGAGKGSSAIVEKSDRNRSRQELPEENINESELEMLEVD